MSLDRSLHELTIAEAAELLGIGRLLVVATETRKTVRSIHRQLEKVMTAIKDLAAKDAALAAELETFLTDVQAKLDSLGALSPEDQATVDQVASDLDAFTAKLQGADPGAPAAPPATA